MGDSSETAENTAVLICVCTVSPLLTAGLFCLIEAVGTFRLAVAPPASRNTLTVQAGELCGGAGLFGWIEKREEEGV